MLNSLLYVQTDPAMEAYVQTNTDDQDTRQVRRTPSNSTQPWPTVGSLFSTNSCHSTDSDQGERQSDAEAQDEHASQRDFFNLKTQQQNGDGSRTRNQTARQTEHDDLSRGDFTVGNALPDIVCMSTFMRILVVINRQLQTFQFGMRMPVVMLLVFQVVIMGVTRMPKPGPGIPIRCQ